MKKVSIIGAGSVGSQTAFCLAIKELCDIALVDIMSDLAKAKALDIQEGLPIYNSNSQVVGGNDYQLTNDSDIVIVTAGLPRKPGMSREDLIEVNAKIFKIVIPEIIKRSPNCIIITVTNPLDAMTYLTYKLSDFSRYRIMGMAGALDTSRLRAFLKSSTNVKIEKINGLVMGNHGDSMVPIISHSKISNKKISYYLNNAQVKNVIKKVRGAGEEIVRLLKTSSTCFAPAMALTQMVEAILKNTKSIIPATVYLKGEYNLDDVCIGVPVVIGKKGVEKILEIKFNTEEKKEFYQSAQNIKKLICQIK